jgi:hypothetical protein
MVGDGHAMGVAAEILQHIFGATKGTFQLHLSFAKSSCTTLKGFLSPWGGSSVWDRMLIRRSAKMLAENVDCPGRVSKKNLALRKTALKSTLPPHNDGVARRVSERIESCFHTQSQTGVRFMPTGLWCINDAPSRTRMRNTGGTSHEAVRRCFGGAVRVYSCHRTLLGRRLGEPSSRFRRSRLSTILRRLPRSSRPAHSFAQRSAKAQRCPHPPYSGLRRHDDRAQRFAVATRQTESSPSRNEAVAPTMHARGPLLKDGGREGIRAPGLLIANEEKSKIRCGTTIT